MFPAMCFLSCLIFDRVRVSENLGEESKVMLEQGRARWKEWEGKEGEREKRVGTGGEVRGKYKRIQVEGENKTLGLS